MSVRILHGDCLELLPTLSGLDACICDPPYHLTSIVKRFGADNAAPAQFGTDGAFARASRGFMGKQWDGGDIALRPETWRLVYAALKPGAHLVAFGGTRTFHRMACAIEDAGFEIRDTLMWLYGSGFPKSHDVAQAIDRESGHRRGRVDNPKGGYHGGLTGAQDKWTRENGATRSDKTPITPEAASWQGWGTALKPANEPILVCAKPLTVEQHIAICIDAITERLLWLRYSASDAIRVLNAIRAKCAGVANSVLGNARTRSLVSIGSAPSADLVSTFSELECSVPIRTKDCFVLSHVRQAGNDLHQSESATQLGVVADLLIRLTDISTCAVADPTSVNIGSLWNSISDALLREASKFTISTAIRLTIALRTLNCSLLPNITNDTGDLSPNFEPIILARKPLVGTVAANVLAHGTGAINIDGCRIGTEGGTAKGSKPTGDGHGIYGAGLHGNCDILDIGKGRWPANVLHDGSDEVEAAFAAFGEKPTGNLNRVNTSIGGNGVYGGGKGLDNIGHKGDTGTASRFFYCAKASKADRAGSKHPTVKPQSLMRWLCRLVTPPGGTILDCFAGSGSTGAAAMREGFNAVLIEREAEYITDIQRRIEQVEAEATTIISGAQMDMFA